jgi:hypothetical protein
MQLDALVVKIMQTNRDETGQCVYKLIATQAKGNRAMSVSLSIPWPDLQNY